MSDWFETLLAREREADVQARKACKRRESEQQARDLARHARGKDIWDDSDEIVRDRYRSKVAAGEQPPSPVAPKARGTKPPVPATLPRAKVAAPAVPKPKPLPAPPAMRPLQAGRRHERPIRRVNPSGVEVWVARWTDRFGRRQSAGTFKLRREAQIAIDAAYERDVSAPRRSDTLGGYASSWLDVHPRAASTNDTHARRLAAVLGPVTSEHLRKLQSRGEKPGSGVMVEGRPLRDWPMSDLRRRHASALIDVLLRDQGRAVEGAQGILRTLSAMTEDAITDEVCDANAWKGVRVRLTDPRIQKAAVRRRVLGWREMHALAAAAGEWEAMVRVASDCGLRLGELLALHRADLKLSGCDEDGCPYAQAVDGPRGAHLHVRRSAYNGVVSLLTKRERMRGVDEGGRVVPVSAGLEALLRARPTRIDTPLLFPAAGGTCWWHENFREDVWNPARRASGVEASPQDFRHSWVSLMRAAAIDPADLAAMAGHSVATATAVYTHSLGRSFGRVAEAVGE